jgi:REP element-mobilizing transposase RayT
VPNGTLDAFVVMPNHVHGIIIIASRAPVGAGSEPAPTEPASTGHASGGTRPYGTFITICTQGRMCIFGEIVNGVMHLNEAGHIVAWTWQGLPNHVPNGIWDAFVVMPNHVHGTIIITSRTPATKSYGPPEIVCQFTRAPLSLSKPCLKKAQTNEIKTDKQGR